MQSKRASAVESVANVVLGYLVAIATQAVAFPFLGIAASTSQSLWLGLIFTGVSLVRSYALRRLFNWSCLRDQAPGHPPTV